MRRTMGAVATFAAIWLWTLAFAAMSGGSVMAQGRRGADYFPNVTLTTQDGEPVRFYDDLVKDKRVVIQFMFTR